MLASTKLAVLGLALGVSTSVNAQFSGLSSSCTSAAAGFLLGDLGSCLSLTSLVPVLTSGSDITSSLSSYLSTICTSAACSNTTISNSETTLESSCASDISSGSAIAVGLDEILKNYTPIRSAACLQGNGTYCVVQSLEAIQNATGQQITLSYLTSLLGGNTTALSDLAGLNSSVLCTSCNQAIYQQVVAANASVASSSIGQAVTSKCGANFASATSSVSGVSNQASATASTPATTSSTTSAASLKLSSFSLGHLLGAGLAVAGLVGGVASVAL